MRIKFKKGQQRKFLQDVLFNVSAPSLNELSRRLKLSYGTLKCYFSEKRFMPKILVESLCEVTGIDFNSLNFELVQDNWGQIKGGKKSRKGPMV